MVSRGKEVATAKVSSSASSSTSILPGSLDVLIKPLLLSAISIATAGFLYRLCEPALQPELSTIMQTAPQGKLLYVALAARSLEVLAYVRFGMTDTRDIFALAMLTRVASSVLMHLYYAVPLQLVATVLVIEAVAVFVPIRLFYDDSTDLPTASGTNAVKVAGGRRSAGAASTLPKESSLTLTLTFINAAFMGVGVYAANKTWLPETVVGHFDGIRRVPAAPLPLVVLCLTPAAWALQELVYRHGLIKTLTTTAAVTALADVPKIALVNGATGLGVISVAGSWFLVVAAVTFGIQYILQ